MFSDEQPVRFRGPAGLALTGVRWTGPAGADAPQVLFTPGNGFPVQAYRPALAALAPEVGVHGLNHQGHGGSDVPAHVENWDAMVADMRAYVEQHMRPPVILGGHSMGAMLALRLASEVPALASGLLLLEPPLGVARGEEPSAEFAAGKRAFIDRSRNRRDGWTSREEAAAWFSASVGYRLWDAEARATFVAEGLTEAPDGTVRLTTPPWLEAELYETVPRQEVYAWADRARCAAVVLRGLDSVAVTVASMTSLADALPVAVVLPVPGSHTFPMEHPAETGQRLAEALRLLRGETGLAATGAAAGRRGG